MFGYICVCLCLVLFSFLSPLCLELHLWCPFLVHFFSSFIFPNLLLNSLFLLKLWLLIISIVQFMIQLFSLVMWICPLNWLCGWVQHESFESQMNCVNCILYHTWVVWFFHSTLPSKVQRVAPGCCGAVMLFSSQNHGKWWPKWVNCVMLTEFR